jgi:hypothetical protein
MNSNLLQTVLQNKNCKTVCDLLDKSNRNFFLKDKSISSFDVQDSLKNCIDSIKSESKSSLLLSHILQPKAVNMINEPIHYPPMILDTSYESSLPKLYDPVLQVHFSSQINVMLALSMYNNNINNYFYMYNFYKEIIEKIEKAKKKLTVQPKDESSNKDQRQKKQGFWDTIIKKGEKIFQDILSNEGYEGKPFIEFNQEDIKKIISEGGFLGIEKVSDRLSNNIINMSNNDFNNIEYIKQSFIESFLSAKYIFDEQVDDVGFDILRETILKVDRNFGIFNNKSSILDLDV